MPFRSRCVLAALLLAACTAPPPPQPKEDATTGAPARGGVAVLAEATDLEKPVSLVFQTSLDAELADVLFMGVTRGAWRDGALVPQLWPESPMALAEGWSYTGPDSTDVRFRLRRDVRWSDGRPVTAADVEWTYRTIADPATASPRVDDVSLVDSVRAEGDSAVVFHFRRRSPLAWHQTGIGVAPRHAFAGAAPAAIATHPVLADPARLPVSGPFRVGAWRPGERVELVPNPHFAPAPPLDAVVIRVIPDATARLTALQAGEVDFARPVPTERIPGLRQRMPAAQFHREAGRFWEFVAYNPARMPAFGDPEVRRALGLAVDVPAILRGLGLEGFAAPAAGPYGPLFGSLATASPSAGADTAAARRILAARGWRDSDGDGVLDRNGVPLRFSLMTNSESARRRDVAQALQAQWRAVGVDARIELREMSSFADAQFGRTYEAALGGWAVALDPDISPLFRSDAELNLVGFADAEADRLMDAARAAPTAEAAAPLWRAAAARITAAYPYTWLYHYDAVSAAGERLRGVRVDPTGALRHLGEWWIPADRRLPRDRRGADGTATAGRLPS